MTTKLGRDEAKPVVEVVTDDEKAKMEWARQMRLKFTASDMIKPDGSLDLDYFKPRKVKKAKKWSDKERGLLIQGIEKFGVSHWDAIIQDLLPDWTATELRMKSSMLLGRQSLKEYKDWKGNAEDIAAEHEMNKEIGVELGCWKGGVLVADDDGKVLQKIEEYKQKRQGKRKRDS